MARPKSYNRDEALSRACDAFWEHGYASLGVRAIEELTGLNQFAIRTEFGGKEGLYLEALKLYADHAEISVLAPMKTGGISDIDRFLAGLIDGTSLTSSMWGCLIVNTGVENARVGNPRIAAVARNYWQLLNEHFSMALHRSKDDGELAPGIDIGEASDALVIAVIGIHAMNRIAGSPKAGAPMVNSLLHMMKSWRR